MHGDDDVNVNAAACCGQTLVIKTLYYHVGFQEICSGIVDGQFAQHNLSSTTSNGFVCVFCINSMGPNSKYARKFKAHALYSIRRLGDYASVY